LIFKDVNCDVCCLGVESNQDFCFCEILFLNFLGNPFEDGAALQFAMSLHSNRRSSLEILCGVDLTPHHGMLGLDGAVEQSYDKEGRPTNENLLKMLERKQKKKKKKKKSISD